jgi:hypothetical protein
MSPGSISGVLLLDPMPLDKAISACNKLGESLWTPESHNTSIQTSLDYLVYKNKYNLNQRFWISPLGDIPRTISSTGKLTNVTTDCWLPAICTQNAPFSTKSAQNTTATWQIVVNSNNETITG